jgi:Secretion system C-terminal sorting domain
MGETHYHYKTMKKIYILSISLFAALTVNAQKPFSDKIETMKGLGKNIPNVVCPLETGDANTYVAPPKEYLESLQKKARETAAKSTFIVTYHDFPANTKQSFQRAVDIWSSILNSATPIRVDAYYRVLGDNVLGSARAADFSSYFPGIQKAFTWYPMALAEKIARQEVNGISDPDIIANFNISNVNLKWFFSEGTEKVAPAGTYDFTSVVLHELGHGLGFVSSFSLDNSDASIASWGYNTRRPFIYDTFVVNAAGDALTDTLKVKNGSAAMKAQLTSSALFLNSPAAIAVNSGQSPKIYAPRTYAPASSISHWDDKTYPAGDPNSLMTPAAKPTEINNNPGPMMIGLFGDMGWKGTSLLHTPQKDIEVKPSTVTMKAIIESDTTIIANSMKLTYTTNNDKAFKNQKVVNLTRVGTSNDFTAAIPIAAADTMVLYYMEAKDALGRTNTTPPQAPNYYWSFKVGKDDKIAPNLEFYPTIIAKTTDRIDFLADVEDNFAAGVDSVYMEYSINGAAQKTIGVNKLNIATDPLLSRGLRDKFTYHIKNIFPNLKVGDRVKYRIAATDKSKNKNKAVLPDDGGFFEMAIADPKPTAVADYQNNFDAATTDFVGVGFSITQPSGFSGSIHSDHPYTNGNDYNGGADRILQLLQPITIKSSDAMIRFDEIVLVEPNDKNPTTNVLSKFGERYFYDYVVVEGSIDGGYTWDPFEDGYNCRASPDWLSLWNKNQVKDVANSTKLLQDIFDSGSIGTTNLFHLREINMLKPDNGFLAGDKVLIRFRLYSDELTRGWGWAIDNLRVQVALPAVATAVSLPVDDKIEMTVSPNPSPDALNIKANFKQAGKVQMDVLSSNGSKIMTQNFTSDSQTFNQSLDLKNFPAGTYFIRLYSNESVLMKKFVVAK